MSGLGEVDEDELYTALDWLYERQVAIEKALAKRHLTGGTLVLYDVSSSYVEGRCCPLAKRGYACVPRARGAEPGFQRRHSAGDECSPRTRG